MLGLVLVFLSWPVLAPLGATEAETPSLDSHLEPLRPFLGKTWKGVFANSKPDKPIVDIMHWERILNGRAIRVLHSVNEGSYGGETIYMWDAAQQAVTYHYFTTAGFMTTGTMAFQDGKFLTHEKVTGSSGSVTEVKAVSELKADGSFVVRTEHLKDGKWSLGRETTYRENATAKVVFR